MLGIAGAVGDDQGMGLTPTWGSRPRLSARCTLGGGLQVQRESRRVVCRAVIHGRWG